MTPLLAIDIGNTNTGLAFFNDCGNEHISAFFSVPSASLKSEGGKTSILEAIGSLINNQGIHHSSGISVVVASVVPELNSLITHIVGHLNLCSPLFVSAYNNKILSFQGLNPDSIGSDRIATTAGAYELYGGPIAVVDFGTATTISLAEKRGVFMGGVIMPGIQLMLDCLKDRTAQLPKVELNKVELKEITSALGKETITAMLSGVIIGAAGAVERILRDIEKENGFRLQLVLTGGHSGFMRPYIKRRCRLVPTVIYEGLRRIYLRNKA